MSSGGSLSFAQVTPVGRSAIATLVLVGEQAAEVVSSYFQPLGNKTLTDYPLRRIVFGKWIHPDGTFEELVVSRVADHQLEIHCHGGMVAVEAVAALLVKSGAQQLNWKDLDQLQFGAELPYWKQAEQLLPQTTTTLSTQLVMEHAQGEVEQILQQVAKFKEAGQTQEVRQILQPYEGASQRGRHLIEPWNVVIAGKPNAGKSSLMNQLVGYQRAIVNQQPGTTRDVLRAQTVIHGWPVEFVDTAGLRQGEDAVEVAGVEMAKGQLSQADLVLWIHDLTDPWEAGRIEQIPHQQMLVIGNKADLTTEVPDWAQLVVSAQTSAGIDSLLELILETLVPGFGNPDFKVLFSEAMETKMREISI